MEQCVDVTCPPGAREGDSISVQFGEESFDVTVPSGVQEGDAFSVMLPAGDSSSAAETTPEADRVASALHAILDALEDNDDERLDSIIDGNCAEFAEWTPGSEAKLEWHELFTSYVSECEGFIDEQLSKLECSAEEVFEHAQAYEGADERVRRLIGQLLAMADFEQFCKMMRDRHEILEMFNS